MSEENKQAVRRFIEEAQVKGNLAAIYQYLPSSFVDHTPMPGLSPDRDGIRKLFSLLKIAFPDLTIEFHDQVAEDDRVVTRKTMHGTHNGEFGGIAPTGKQVAVDITDIFRVENGKLIEHWGVVDQVGFMHQIGVMP